MDITDLKELMELHKNYEKKLNNLVFLKESLQYGDKIDNITISDKYYLLSELDIDHNMIINHIIQKYEDEIVSFREELISKGLTIKEN